MSRSRNWCFTINNYTDEDIPKDLPEASQFIIFQKEIGEETHTPHLQGYIQYTKPVGLTWLKRHFHPRAHLEVARGSQEDNIAYCSKPGTRADPLQEPTKFGQVKRQGARTDLATAAAAVMDLNQSMQDIAAEHPETYIRYYRGMMALRNSQLPRAPNYSEKYVICYYGDPRAGKSKAATTEFPDAYIKSCDTKWWDGYEGEEEVILDEFPGSLAAHDCKKLLGEVNDQKETKGGSIQPYVKTYILTTNHHPDEWFPRAKAVDREAVRQRLNELWHFTFVDGVRTKNKIF